MIERQPATISVWAGRILSALVVVILLADAVVNLFAPQLLKAEMSASGFPVELAPGETTALLVEMVVGEPDERGQFAQQVMLLTNREGAVPTLVIAAKVRS